MQNWIDRRQESKQLLFTSKANVIFVALGNALEALVNSVMCIYICEVFVLQSDADNVF